MESGGEIRGVVENAVLETGQKGNKFYTLTIAGKKYKLFDANKPIKAGDNVEFSWEFSKPYKAPNGKEIQSRYIDIKSLKVSSIQGQAALGDASGHFKQLGREIPTTLDMRLAPGFSPPSPPEYQPYDDEQLKRIEKKIDLILNNIGVTYDETQ